MPKGYKLRLGLVIALLPGISRGAGTTGADFLNIGVGSRPGGMGGAFVAVADDVNAVYWNPAGLAKVTRQEATFMHNERGEDIRFEFLSYAHPVSRLGGTLGGSLSYLSIGEIDGYSPGGGATGELSASGLAVSLAYGRKLGHEILGGLNVKLIRETLDDVSATTFAADMGLLYQTPVEGLSLGLNLQNVGPGLKFISEKADLPRSLKLGAAYRMRVLGTRAVWALDFNVPKEAEKRFHVGTEWWITNFTPLRFGYQSDYDIGAGIRMGAGVGTRNYSIDYAFMPNQIFDNSHRFSITVRFGKSHEIQTVQSDIEKHLELGQEYFNNGDLLRARQEFAAILAVAPGHKKAEDLLARTTIRLEEGHVGSSIQEALARGRELLAAGELVSAKAEFQSILSIEPEHADAKRHLASIEAQFNNVVEEMFRRGESYHAQGEYAESLAEMEKVLAFEPKHDKALAFVERVKSEMSEVETVKKIRRAKSLHAQGLKLYKQNKPQEALQMFTKALALYPEFKEAKDSKEKAVWKLASQHYDQGLESCNEEKFEQCISEFKKLLELMPDHKKGRSNLEIAVEKLKRNRSAQARELTEQGIKAYSRGSVKEAIGFWEKALELDPEQQGAKVNLKRAQQELQR